jgi:Methylamine utilisation protein MauE
MSAAASPAEVFDSLAAQLAAFQAVLLLASAAHKLLRRARTRTVMRVFAGVPAALAPLAVAAAAAAEIGAAVLLWVPALRAEGGLLAALIWGAYLALILRAMALGRRDVDCGCTFGAARRPLGSYAVARNTGLTAMALLVALDFAPSAQQPIGGPQILAAFALLALYVALDQAMALAPPRAGELL